MRYCMPCASDNIIGLPTTSGELGACAICGRTTMVWHEQQFGLGRDRLNAIALRAKLRRVSSTPQFNPPQ